MGEKCSECKESKMSDFTNSIIREFAEKLKNDVINYDVYDILENNYCMYSYASIKAYKDMVDDIADKIIKEKYK